MPDFPPDEVDVGEPLGKAEESPRLGAVATSTTETATVTSTAAAEAIRMVSCRRDNVERKGIFMADTPLNANIYLYDTTKLTDTQTHIA